MFCVVNVETSMGYIRRCMLRYGDIHHAETVRMRLLIATVERKFNWGLSFYCLSICFCLSDRMETLVCLDEKILNDECTFPIHIKQYVISKAVVKRKSGRNFFPKEKIILAQ